MIAVDQDGRPALVAHELGKGKTLLSAYPLEHYLAHVPSVFDKPETRTESTKHFVTGPGSSQVPHRSADVEVIRPERQISWLCRGRQSWREGQT